MKRFPLILLLIFSLSLLSGCSGDELPPPPPPPGQVSSVGGAIAGLAVQLPDWAAEAKNTVITPKEAYFGDGVVVSTSGFDYIYKNGYVFNSKSRIWEKFALQGEFNQEWIKGQAVGSVPIQDARFAEGDNYLVVYACTKVSGKWNCNDSKWMLIPFKVLGSATGDIPESANINDMVVNSPINPFAITSTLAEKDNFNEILVIRYDARYREPNGLVVLVHVFDFNNRGELDKTINTLFRTIVQQGFKKHNGQNVALFLDEFNQRVAVWTSGKKILYVQTNQAASANKEIIDAYLRKYPSDLTRP